MEENKKPYVYEVTIKGETMFIQHKEDFNSLVRHGRGKNDRFSNACKNIIKALNILKEEITTAKVVMYLKQNHGFEDYDFKADGCYRA